MLARLVKIVLKKREYLPYFAEYKSMIQCSRTRPFGISYQIRQMTCIITKRNPTKIKQHNLIGSDGNVLMN